VIVSSGPPHSAHLAAKRLARRLGVPFVVDLRDDWASDPFGYDIVPWQGWLNRRFERAVVRSASAIIAVTEPMQAAVLARHPEQRQSVLLIPNGFDPADFEEVERYAPSQDGVTEILFAGRLMDQESLGDLYEALDALNSEGEHVRLRIVGVVERRQLALLEPYRDRPWLRLHGPVPHKAAVQAMVQADVLLVVTLQGGSGASPNMTGKIYECLAAGRPIVLIGPQSAASGLIRSLGVGAHADPAEPGAIRAAVLSAIQQARAGGAHPNQLLLPAFDRRDHAHQWAAILRRVSGVKGLPHRAPD
jgi:glycosyltransferase involved in cell wall biosynthesis